MHYNATQRRTNETVASRARAMCKLEASQGGKPKASQGQTKGVKQSVNIMSEHAVEMEAVLEEELGPPGEGWSTRDDSVTITRIRKRITPQHDVIRARPQLLFCLCESCLVGYG